jgi:undecaprenyl-diphosphatase
MLSATVFLTLGTLLSRFVMGYALKAYLLIIALSLTLLVGVSRVYMGVHYPTDVLAGWAAGLLWALICWLLARFLQRRGAVEKEDEQAANGGVP